MIRVTLTRTVGIIRRPRATLTQVAREPRWAALLAVLTIGAALANVLLMNTEVGRLALVDQWERTAVAFGRPLDDAGYAELLALSAYGPAVGMATAVLNVPGLVLMACAAIHVAFGRGGTTVPFKGVLAVGAHAGVILALRQVVSAPIAYARETLASATSVGLWFPAFDEGAPVARFLWLTDLFVIWWAIVLAIGVSVLYRHRATWLALAFVGLYLALAAGLAVVMAVLGGTV